MAPADILVTDKDNFTKTKTIAVENAAKADLAPSSVRAQTLLLGLTANNTSYAKAGRALHWWDAYPVPSSDAETAEKFGQVPGWGYAKIFLSNVDALPPGSLLWGFWPFHDAPVDLQLTYRNYDAPVDENTGYWVEKSAHRQKMMPLYNRYYPVHSALPAPSKELDDLAWKANLGPLWTSAHLMSRYVFAPAAARKTGQQVHPFGMGLPWQPEDADISETAFVLFGASGRTAMCFARLMRSREQGDKPAKMVAVTSQGSVQQVRQSGYYDDIIEYSAIDSAEKLQVAASKVSSSVKRVILMDVAGRGNSISDFYDALKDKPSKTTVIKVGGEIKAISPAEMQAAMARATEMGALQFNASAVRDNAVQKVGEARQEADTTEAWSRFLAEGSLPGMRLKWGKGVKGPGGVEEEWSRLCSGQVGPQEALVFTF